MSAVTLSGNALPGVLEEHADLAGWQLCVSGPECSVVYFRADAVLMPEHLREPPFHKSSGPDRRVCFCFGHSERDIIEDVRKHGLSTIQPTILEACRRGEDDCERLNPEGRCCLGNVAKVVKAAGAASAHAGGCCCSHGSDPEK